MALAGTILDQGLPLGGYPQAVFSYKEIAYQAQTANGSTFSSRVFCATDATWLDNELTGIPTYDNLQFATQAMEWLACGRAPEDVILVFDEAAFIEYMDMQWKMKTGIIMKNGDLILFL